MYFTKSQTTCELKKKYQSKKCIGTLTDNAHWKCVMYINTIIVYYVINIPTTIVDTNLEYLLINNFKRIWFQNMTYFNI